MNLNFENEQVVLNGIKLAGRFCIHVNPDWISVTPIAERNTKSDECIARANEAAAAAVTLGETKYPGSPEFDDTRGQKCCGLSGIEPQMPVLTPHDKLVRFLNTRVDEIRERIVDLETLHGQGHCRDICDAIHGWKCRETEVMEILNSLPF